MELIETICPQCLFTNYSTEYYINFAKKFGYKCYFCNKIFYLKKEGPKEKKEYVSYNFYTK